MIKKLLLSTAFIISMGLSTVFAQALEFDIINKTGVDLYGVFVTASEDESWGEDLLPLDLFTDGSKVTVHIDEDYGDTCDFDIKVTTDSNQTETILFENANLCAIISITLHSDGTYELIVEE